MTNRINGKSLSLKFGTLEVFAEAGEFSLENEDAKGGFTTFADDAAGGAVQWFITVKALTSLDAASWWRFLWTNTGATVTWTLSPLGNSVGTSSAPTFTGSALVGAQPPLGGAAGDEWNFDYRLDLVGNPTMHTS